MKDITKIVIKGRSGYVPMEFYFDEKITITPGYIAYESKPYPGGEDDIPRKWKFTSDTPEFKEQFDAIAFEIEEVLACRPDVQITDMNEAEFQITYSDKTKKKEKTLLFGDWYYDLFDDIKAMVPFTEYVPMTLITDEDFEEEE